MEIAPYYQVPSKGKTYSIAFGGVWLLAACSSSPPQISGTPPKNPITVTAVSKPEGATPAQLNEKSEGVRIEIRARESLSASKFQRFEISSKWIPPENTQLKAELKDLPVSIPSQKLKDGLWQLEFPPNVIQLLSKGTASAQYSGTLQLENSKVLPFELVIRPTSEKKTKRSAG